MGDTPSQILSQEEVDLLMQAESQGEFEESEAPSDPLADAVTACDITQQDRIIRGRLTALEISSQRLARRFQGTLSATVRQSIDLTSERPRLMKFQEYLSYLTTPACLNVVELSPLRGHAVVSLDPSMTLDLIDLFFGGANKRKTRRDDVTEFTAVERGVIRRIVKLFLGDLVRSWEGIFKLTPAYRLTESNPAYLTVIDPGDVVINSAWEVAGDGIQGRVNLLIPYASVEPIKEQLAGGVGLDDTTADTWRNRMHYEVNNTEVEMVVELGRRRMSLREITGLDIGTFIGLDRGLQDTVEMMVEGVPKYEVRPVLDAGDVMVRIEAPLDGDARRRKTRSPRAEAPAQPAPAPSAPAAAPAPAPAPAT